MLPLETKQSGGKLLPHSDLRGGGGVSSGSTAQNTKGNEIVGMWTGLGWLAANQLASQEGLCSME